MSTPHEPDPTPTGDAEQERVRRILADLAHTEQVEPPAMPPEVAARLETTLAELRDERAGEAPVAEEPTARVVPLRRRLAPALAAAAAVVIVAGGGAAVLGSNGSDGADSSTAGGSAESSADSGAEATDGSQGESSQSQAQPEEQQDDRSRDDAEPGAPTAPQDTPGRLARVPVLSSGSFADDAARLVADGEVAAARADAASEDLADRGAVGGVAGSGCAVPDPDLGAATVVSLDGDPVVLVVGPPRSGERAVTAYACADGAELRSTQVPADGP